jgi:hypothetical protein
MANSLFVNEHIVGQNWRVQLSEGLRFQELAEKLGSHSSNVADAWEPNNQSWIFEFWLRKHPNVRFFH